MHVLASLRGSARSADGHGGRQAETKKGEDMGAELLTLVNQKATLTKQLTEAQQALQQLKESQGQAVAEAAKVRDVARYCACVTHLLTVSGCSGSGDANSSRCAAP